jgi:hypothetical protein
VETTTLVRKGHQVDHRLHIWTQGKALELK